MTTFPSNIKHKMSKNVLNGIIILTLVIYSVQCDNSVRLDYKNTKIWGPGLTPDEIILPARYFFIHPADLNGKLINVSLPQHYEIKLLGGSKFGACRTTVNQIDRKDGSTIVRYRFLGVCYNVEIHIKYDGNHLGKSPYIIDNKIYADSCVCPLSLNSFMTNFNCSLSDRQIELDMMAFQKINFTNIRSKIIQKFNSPGSISLCNYVVKNNEIHRKCYGQYTGFKMFMDAILLSLTRKVWLPDIEFFINLGDWPLVKKGGQSRTTGPYPIFSWCGSDDSFDIVLPTYDVTESTLENMGRVLLDMLSVQKVDKLWNEKIEKGFWRGRDSRRERLDLVDISRQYPELLNASLTNFFFFRDEESKYGPKEAHISFLEFFDYKYQINIDGTVAAYRFPYLLAGNSVVFKQESPYYEHFYKKLIPNKHYIPFKRNLSDLVEKIQWAKDNDIKAKEIMMQGRRFAQDNLMPTDIFCYHVLLFKEWSKRTVSNIQIIHDMVKVSQQDSDCHCPESPKDYLLKDEL